MRIGVDIGGTTITVGIIDEKNNVVIKKIIKTQSNRKAETIIKEICQLINCILDEAKLDISVIKYIGIGCAGMIDRKKGVVVYSNNINWNEVPIATMFKEKFNIPVFLENDAIAATIGEYAAGAGSKYESVVMLTLGTGIGGGFITDKKIYKGHNDQANIFGHMVIEQSGIKCNCGRHGCFEAYASTAALVRFAEKAAKNNSQSLLSKYTHITGESVFETIQLKDEVALDIFDKHTYYLSVGIANIVNMLNPQAVIIGGAICKQGELLLEPIRKKVKQQIYCKNTTMPHIISAELNENAGIIGAANICKYM